MENNVPYRAIGISRVKFKLVDGTVRTFDRVRHVPNLKKNLISLCTLDSEGCMFFGEGRVFRFVKLSMLYWIDGKVPVIRLARLCRITKEQLVKL